MKAIIALLLSILLGLSGASADKTTNTQKEGTPAVISFSNEIGIDPDYISEYNVIIEDPTVLAYSSVLDYGKQTDPPECGGSYNTLFTFKGLKAGTTSVKVEERCAADPGYDHIYKAVVDEDLNVTLEKVETVTPQESTEKPEPETAFVRFTDDVGIDPDYICEYKVVISDTRIVGCDKTPDHGEPTDEPEDGGSNYTVFTFKGIKPGTTSVRIEERCPAGFDRDHIYKVTVDEDLNVTMKEVRTIDVREMRMNKK